MAKERRVTNQSYISEELCGNRSNIPDDYKGKKYKEPMNKIRFHKSEIEKIITEFKAKVNKC